MIPENTFENLIGVPNLLSEKKMSTQDFAHCLAEFQNRCLKSILPYPQALWATGYTLPRLVQPSLYREEL